MLKQCSSCGNKNNVRKNKMKCDKCGGQLKLVKNPAKKQRKTWKLQKSASGRSKKQHTSSH